MEKQTGKTIDKIIIEAIQNSDSIFAWKSLNGIVDKCEMKIKALRKEYNEIELEIVISETKKVTDILTGKREFNFYLPESSVSFVGSLKQTINEKKFKIVIPNSYEFFERRKHERVQLKKAFLTFEINKTSYKKSLHDISIGGFSIILPRAERVSIKKEVVLENCILEINTERIRVDAECVSTILIDRHRLESLPYGGNKLAFRFKKLAITDKEILTEIIMLAAILNKQLKGA